MKATQYPDLTPKERARLYNKQFRERKKNDPEYQEALREYRRKRGKEEYASMKSSDPQRHKQYNKKRSLLAAKSRAAAIDRGDGDKYKQADRRYYQENRERCLQQSANRRATLRDPSGGGYPQYLFETAKARARAGGREFSIGVEDIIIPPTCPVLGIPLVLTNSRQQFNSPSVDRIDPTKGYTKDNIRVISWRANALKKDATPEEIERLYRFFCVGNP